MLKPTLRRVLLVCLVTTLCNIIFSQKKCKFTFAIKAAVLTSAGVFTKGGQLVKTLWSGVRYQAGNYEGYWDGTNDDGKLMQNGTYYARVLASNATYKWEGVIGNTSLQQSGPSVYHAMECIYAIAFTTNNGYFAAGYNEQMPTIGMFGVNSPQSKSYVLTKGCVSVLASTDNNYVYWDAADASDTSKTFVYATRVADNGEVTNFKFGTPVSVLYGRTYANAIDTAYNPRSRITGLSVQKKGNYLFVAHRANNQIDVLNKATGQVVRKISMQLPTGLATDTSGNIWVISGQSVYKYLINQDGSLAPRPTLMLAGLVAPLALAVSNNNSTVIVADGGNSQQVKAYNSATGASIWVLGQQGGYATNPTVANNKFYFGNDAGVFSFVSFASDGSFWVGDPGNCRAQHFTANQTYIECIMYQRRFYSSVADPDNPSRVFADFKEFKVDYSKTLSPTNGSWTLVKNWGYGVPAEYNDQYFRLRNLTTFSNGRTYAFLRHQNNLAVVELAAAGLRYTGIELPSLNYEIMANGSLLSFAGMVEGKPSVWMLQTLSGFDALGNPIWSTPTKLATSPPATEMDPLFHGLGNSTVTSSGVLVSFDAGLPPNGSLGYHLGGIRAADSTWLWRTAKSTFHTYTGAYPADGGYDIGNKVQYAGSYTRSLGKVIIWGYHGEFWKNSQVNKWTLVNDDGLFIGQFGVAQEQYPEAAPMMAGNAYAVSFVQDSLGNAYVYLNDESYHGGIHRWKITGLNTINEQTAPITLLDTVHGLTGAYFDGQNLDNFSIRTTRVDTVVNFANQMLQGTAISTPASFSVRWAGFVTPVSSGTYNFYTAVNSGVRLWVNDTIVIDHWQNTANSTFSGSATLALGQQASIRLEYSNTSVPSIALCWSANGLAKQVIPTQNLHPVLLDSNTTSGTDLMEGLSFQSALANNMYGWQRNPAVDDNTNPYTQWWSVLTGYETYNRPASADVQMQYAQASGNYTVTRTLGVNTAVKLWQVNGIIDYTNNAPNDYGGKGGAYLDVLDDSDKIIARLYTKAFYPNGVYNGATNQVGVYAGSTVIALDLINNIQPVLYAPQNFAISAANGMVTFSYGAYKPVTIKVFDLKSNWRNPATLRFYFFGNGNNYRRNIDVKSMYFSKTQDSTVAMAAALNENAISTDVVKITAVAKTPDIEIYPNPVKNFLHAHFTQAQTGVLQVVSVDGKIQKNYTIMAQSLDMSLDVTSLAPGLYFLRLVGNPANATKLFVK